MKKPITLIAAIIIINFISSPAFAVVNVGTTSVLEPSYVENEVIVKYKPDQSPMDIQRQVNKRTARAASFFGQVQNTWENFSLRLQNQETPEDQLNRLVSVNSQAGVVSSQTLFESKVLGEGTPPELQGFIFYQTNGQQSVGEMVQSYSQLPEVEFAEPNSIYTIQAVPNDAYYPQMWNLTKIQMEQAWEQTRGNSEVIVAVIDTGADFNHEDLKDHLVPGYNFVNDDNNPQDDNGHGTHLSGTIGALTNNSKGIAGINWEVKIMPLKALNSRGSGSTSQITNAVKYAADNGVKVINMSLGGCASQPLPDGSCPHQNNQISSTWKAALNYAIGKNVTIVVAAGNSNDDAQWYSPANYNNTVGRAGDILVVAATGPSDTKAYYSNYGSVINISAPGGDKRGGSNACVSQNDIANCILSTVPGNGYQPWEGTSMASPHVAGAAGLLLAKNPNLTPDQVESYLKNNTDAVTSSVPIGTGRLNANKALAAVSGGTQPTATPTVAPTGSTVTPSPTITPPAGKPTATPTPPTFSPSPSPTPLTSPTPPPAATNTPPPGAHPCLDKALTGDYDCNGKVEEADLTAWLSDFQKGKATLSFFEYWRRAFFTP